MKYHISKPQISIFWISKSLSLLKIILSKVAHDVENPSTSSFLINTPYLSPHPIAIPSWSENI